MRIPSLTIRYGPLNQHWSEYVPVSSQGVLGDPGDRRDGGVRCSLRCPRVRGARPPTCTARPFPTSKPPVKVSAVRSPSSSRISPVCPASTCATPRPMRSSIAASSTSLAMFRLTVSTATRSTSSSPTSRPLGPKQATRMLCPLRLSSLRGAVMACPPSEPMWPSNPWP